MPSSMSLAQMVSAACGRGWPAQLAFASLGSWLPARRAASFGWRLRPETRAFSLFSLQSNVDGELPAAVRESPPAKKGWASGGYAAGGSSCGRSRARPATGQKGPSLQRTVAPPAPTGTPWAASGNAAELKAGAGRACPRRIQMSGEQPPLFAEPQPLPVPPKPGTPAAAPAEHLDDGAWKGEAGGGDAAATSMTPRDAGAGGGAQDGSEPEPEPKPEPEPEPEVSTAACPFWCPAARC